MDSLPVQNEIARGNDVESRRFADLLFFSAAGAFISFLLHASFFATLSTVMLDRTVEPAIPQLETRMPEEPEPEEPKEIIAYELADPNDRDFEVREVVNARSVGQSLAEKVKPQSAPTIPNEEMVAIEFRNSVYDIPEGLDVSDQLVVKGNVGEGLIQIESAMDRITHEIAQNLIEKKVLVVWLIDASASVVGQRKTIARRLKRVYGELEALGETGQLPRRKTPILTGVVAFGARTRFLTKEPTQNFEDVLRAFESSPIDESGVENVFTAVNQVMSSWKDYRVRNGRRIMIVTITDEAGDDFGPPLENAIRVCRHYGAKAYVVGPSAVFGKRHGFIPYRAPEDGQVYNLPIDLGPETAMMENVDLPFWYGGTQLKYLSSGFAPYALARLVYETGGTYFMTDMASMSGFSPQGIFSHESLASFVPDYRYGSREEFFRDVQEHPLRLAVVRAAGLSTEFPVEGTPLLELRVNPNNFRNVATEAQKKVARSQAMIDSILQAFPKGIERELELEASPRWRMAFCLSYGRLLAQRVRCMEYNLACAELKGAKTAQDVQTKSNHWLFRPSDEIQFAVGLKADARKARELLDQVLAEAGGTPWAALAARELRDPLGIRIEERFVPPPPPVERTRQPTNPRKRVLFAPEPRKPQAPPKPKPKPKLPKF